MTRKGSKDKKDMRRVTKPVAASIGADFPVADRRGMGKEAPRDGKARRLPARKDTLIMTPYPFPGLTKAQRKVFEEIASGNHTLTSVPHQKATLEKLLEFGAIIRTGEEVIGTGWMAVQIPSYEASPSFHAAWCAENFDEEGNPLEQPGNAKGDRR